MPEKERFRLDLRGAASEAERVFTRVTEVQIASKAVWPWVASAVMYAIIRDNDLILVPRSESNERKPAKK